MVNISNPGDIKNLLNVTEGAGSNDPTAAKERSKQDGYPRESYKDASGINAGARGQGNQTLKTSGAWPGSNLGPLNESQSQYGQSQTIETPGGHYIEYNDTPGYERILFKHKSGSGIEMRSDGSILISASNLIFDVRGDMTSMITGNLKNRVGGSKIDKLGGESTTEAGGNIIQDTGGTLMAKAAGSQVTEIGKNQRITVAGEASQTTVGPKTEINLTGYSNNVKGDMKIRTEGDIGIYGSGSMGLTAQKRGYMSSPSLSMTGDQLEIVGQRGTIGGENVIAYSYNSYVGKTLHAGESVSTKTLRGSQSVTAPYIDTTRVDTTVVHGDLNGTASLSIGSGSTVASAGTQSHAADDSKATAKADETIVAGRHLTGLNGVKFVKVDPGCYIRCSVDRSSNNGYIKETT